MSFQTFKKFLQEQMNASDEEISEQAMAAYGNYYEELEPDSISKTVMEQQWEERFTLKTNRGVQYKVFKSNTTELYRVGRWEVIQEKEYFTYYAEIELTNERICGVGYKAVALVRVYENLRGHGIATNLYKALVKVERINLISDTIQFFGARKLWSGLSHAPDMIVDVIDTSTCEIREGVKVKHGNGNYDFDTSVWHENPEDYVAKNIRLILRDIGDV